MPRHTRVVAIIPARYASTRFPGKPLVPIGGVPMIERVHRQAAKARLVDEVVVATDDRRIFDLVTGFGGQAVMTRADHPTGTDRLSEAVLARQDVDVVVNVQGDEPLIDPDTIDAAVKPLLDDSNVEMSTLAAPITSPEELSNPNLVKVVRSTDGSALYFSRLPIPCYRDERAFDDRRHLGHVGLYVYRRDTLLKLALLPPTPLEQAECLEQLRALENGIRIRVVEIAARSLAVDTPEDVAAVEAAIYALR